MTAIVPCPLPPTSDLPFSCEALRAYNEYGRQVLDEHGITPNLALSSSVCSPHLWVMAGALAATLASRAANGGAAQAYFKVLRALTGPSGTLLRREREAAGLGQRAIAREAGMSRSGLHAIETGQHVSTPEVRACILRAIRMAAAAKNTRMERRV